MFINQMKSPLLGSHALALASLHKTRIRVLSLFSSNPRQGVMTLFNVHIEKMICREILAALNAPVCVEIVVMGFVIVVEPETNRFSVGR